tara:strand:+ start:27 stop:260 length:234 start_codon:yes stop_codon:yes gene_type:complete
VEPEVTTQHLLQVKMVDRVAGLDILILILEETVQLVKETLAAVTLVEVHLLLMEMAAEAVKERPALVVLLVPVEMAA